MQPPGPELCAAPNPVPQDGIWNLNDDGGKKKHPRLHHYPADPRPIDREKKYILLLYISSERETSERVRACGFNDVSAKLERGKTL